MISQAIVGGIAPASVMIRSTYSAGVTSKAGFRTRTCGRVAAISSGSTSEAGRSSNRDQVAEGRERRELVGLCRHHDVRPGLVGRERDRGRPDLVHDRAVDGDRVRADDDEVGLVDERADRRVDDVVRPDPLVVQPPDRQEPLAPGPDLGRKDLDRLALPVGRDDAGEGRLGVAVGHDHVAVADVARAELADPVDRPGRGRDEGPGRLAERRPGLVERPVRLEGPHHRPDGVRERDRGRPGRDEQVRRPPHPRPELVERGGREARRVGVERLDRGTGDPAGSPDLHAADPLRRLLERHVSVNH